MFCEHFAEIGIGRGWVGCYRCDVAVNLMAGEVCRNIAMCGNFCGLAVMCGRQSECMDGGWQKQGERHVGTVKKNQ